MSKPNELKLIYVLKVGYNTMGEGVYEFIFSRNIQDIDAESWGWLDEPANGNANPPDKDKIDKILSLKTNLFDLKCLHEANDRPYIHGFHTIHALAYEIDDPNEIQVKSEFDMIYDELPLLVFHYGMTLSEVEDIFYQRDIVLIDDKLIHNTEIKIPK